MTSSSGSINFLLRCLKAVAGGVFVFQFGILPASAEEKLPSDSEKPFKFSYELDLHTYFDNREYDTDVETSQTIFGLRLDGTVGFDAKTGKTRHRVQAGAGSVFDFGGDITVSPYAFYELSTPLRHSKFSLTAGLFPINRQKALYGRPFYSEETQYRRKNIAGLQFGWTSKKFHYELGLDWLGMLRDSSPATREEFMVYSGGHHKLFPGFRLGYALYLHHYACSREQLNVVDDILLNPYAEMNFASMTPLQTLLLRLGYLQALSRDRDASSSFYTPAKGEFLFEIRKWNVGLENDFFFGADLMPLYDALDPAGETYGSRLYMGDPFMRSSGGKSFGFYDRLSLYYEPNISSWMSLRLQLTAHFNNAYSGFQQIISVRFHFDRAMYDRLTR